MAFTIEGAIKNTWEATAALCECVPASKVFIGIVPQNDLDGSPVNFPVASIRNVSAQQHLGSSDGDSVGVEAIRILAGDTSREVAARAAQAIFDTFFRFDGTYENGTILSMMQPAKIELQDPDGAWYLGWVFQTQYTIA